MTVREGVPAPVSEAFARPPGAHDSLQRPPTVPDVIDIVVVDTAQPREPWRDPRSDVVLGEPAQPEPAATVAAPATMERFTLREALFQRRLRPGALVMLVVTALAVGAAGGAAALLLSPRPAGEAASPPVTLASAQPAISRPPGSVAGIAARVLPAVVSIDVRVGDGGETGSGIVIDGRGYIVTNNHVITMATDADASVTVVFNDVNDGFNDSAGHRVPAHVVGRDPASDLAVLKVDKVSGLTVADLGDSATLQVGDAVIAVGSPLGLAGTVTTGIVSALHRPVRLGGAGTDTNAVIDAIQTDAPINPGNSGGPLVDATGAVVGINTAIRTLSGDPLSGGSIGLGFAIPIDDARQIAETLIAHGTVSHPSLGVNVRSATDGAIDGAQVQSVDAGGPAARAGIAEGDVIVAIGTRAVRTADEMIVAVQQHAVGDAVPVTVLRDGRSMTVTVTLGAA